MTLRLEARCKNAPNQPWPGSDGTFGPQNDGTVIWPPACAQNDGTFHLGSKNALKILENLLEIPQNTENVSIMSSFSFRLTLQRRNNRITPFQSLLLLLFGNLYGTIITQCQRFMSELPELVYMYTGECGNRV